MKKFILTLTISGIAFSSFAVTKAEAEKKIQQYFGDTKNYTIQVCEDKNYYIGEIYLKGYEGISTIRKVYINKNSGEILPEMARASDFCYMLQQ